MPVWCRWLLLPYKTQAARSASFLYEHSAPPEVACLRVPHMVQEIYGAVGGLVMYGVLCTTLVDSKAPKTCAVLGSELLPSGHTVVVVVHPHTVGMCILRMCISMHNARKPTPVGSPIDMHTPADQSAVFCQVSCTVVCMEVRGPSQWPQAGYLVPNTLCFRR